MISRRIATGSGLSVAAAGALGFGFWPRLAPYEKEVDRQRRLIASDPTIREFVRMATLAANGHNTQPWVFAVDDQSVSIYPDFSRRTSVVDPDDHHLYISLGCAAENLVTAASAFGRDITVLMRREPEHRIDIELGMSSTTDNNLYQAIPHRQSTRSEFDGQRVSAADIAVLRAAAQEDGVSVLLFTEPSDLETILEFVVEGNSNQMDDPAFIAELRDWLRFSSSRAIEMGDGLFSACSGNPIVPEWIGDHLFNAFFTKGSETDKYSRHIRSSAGVAVFLGEVADPEHWIKVGRSFERFALQATALGIRNAHINQPIEDTSVRPEFARWLGIPEARPDLVVRFGRAPAMPMSLRRPVDQVLLS